MNALLRLLGLESGADVHGVTGGAWRITEPLSGGLLAALIVAGLALALVNFLPQISMRPGVRIGTFLLRLCMLGMLLVVLSGVEWHVNLDLNKKQDWVVLVDDSASMATRDVDGQSRFDAALADLDSLRASAADHVNLTVQTVSGNPLGDAAGQGPTLFQDAVARAALSRVHPNRLVVLTDGRDSQQRHLGRLGEDLKAHDIELDVRLYGSSSRPVDSGITAEPVRNIIRLGEEAIIRGAVSGNVSQSEQNVTLKEDDKVIKTFAVTSEQNWRFEVEHMPKKAGAHVYTLELPGGDTVAENNSTRFTVNVVEEKINVLLVEGFPRYEYKLIKAVLEVDPLVNLVCIAHIPGGGVYVQGEPLHRNADQGLIASQSDLFKYDIVILRDVSRSYFRAGGDVEERLLANLVEFVVKRGGGLVVTGGQDVYRAGGFETSHLAEILPFDLSDELSTQAQFEGLFFVSFPKPAYQHPILRLLPETGDNRERLNGMRQLDGSNNVGRFKPLATPLMTRTVEVKEGEKTVEKEVPVMAYIAVGEGKVLATSVDSLWRWQLQPEYEEPPLTMMLANSIRFLAPPPGRKTGAPNVSLNDGTPQVGQEILLSTELKDANFDPIRNADLLVTVTRPDGKALRIYPRDLPEEPGVYSYRVTLDQAGAYEVKAQYGKLDSVRRFLAGTSAGEFADLSVDREAMDQLAKAAAGRVSKPDGGDWAASLDTQPATAAAVRDLEVWNSPLVLIVFLALVGADCFIRKRQGLA